MTRSAGLVACFVSLLGLGLAMGADAPTERPNIVILLADDLGWGDVGYNGGVIDTPNIDRLAKEGVRLTNFHVAPLCSPTRAGLMTGRWPIRYGMGEAVITPWRKHGLPTSERTLADLLATAGYQRRAVIGKWHLGHYKRRYLPLNRGFTFFYGHYNGAFDYFTHEREGERDWHRNWETRLDEGYSTDLIGREAAKFVAESPRHEPFFLYVPFNAPHTPLQARESDIAKYRNRIEGPRQQIYAAMVDSLDQAIGQILSAIKKRGVADNTFVLFLSDNGATSRYGDNGPYRSSKGSVYEGGVRVPAVVRWPDGKLVGGRRCDALMGMIDVYPTVKRIAGVSTDDRNPIDGRDMLDVMLGKADAPQRNWFSYVAQGSPDKLAVSDGTWKLLVQGGSVLDVPLDAAQRKGKPESIRVELFHLARDPGETRNVAEAQPEIVTRLLKELHQHRRLKREGIPHFRAGARGFVAPEDWIITQE